MTYLQHPDDIEAREDVGYESEEDLETAEEKKLRLMKAAEAVKKNGL